MNQALIEGISKIEWDSICDSPHFIVDQKLKNRLVLEIHSVIENNQKLCFFYQKQRREKE